MIVNDKSQYYCNKCKKWGSMGDSTGNINKHVRRVHFQNGREVNAEMGDNELAANSASLVPVHYPLETKRDILRRIRI